MENGRPEPVLLARVDFEADAHSSSISCCSKIGQICQTKILPQGLECSGAAKCLGVVL